VVFEIRPTGEEIVLYAFTGGTDGWTATGALTPDGYGNFYGAAAVGGLYDFGTIFKITASGTFSLVYTLTGGTDGEFPTGNMIFDSQGNLYGTTFGTGANYCNPPNCGTIFKLTP
jgi:uncharacterized repeat protein (TIGR03803 family)